MMQSGNIHDILVTPFKYLILRTSQKWAVADVDYIAYTALFLKDDLTLNLSRKKYDWVYKVTSKKNLKGVSSTYTFHYLKSNLHTSISLLTHKLKLQNTSYLGELRDASENLYEIPECWSTTFPEDFHLKAEKFADFSVVTLYHNDKPVLRENMRDSYLEKSVHRFRSYVEAY
jgi:hypothetical protein